MDLATYKQAAVKYQELRQLLWRPFEYPFRIKVSDEEERPAVDDEEWEREWRASFQAARENAKGLFDALEEIAGDTDIEWGFIQCFLETVEHESTKAKTPGEVAEVIEKETNFARAAMWFVDRSQRFFANQLLLGE